MPRSAQLRQPFLQLQKDQDWDAYLAELEAASLQWWFEVDVTCLARHAGPVLPHTSPDAIPPGLGFFLALVEPDVTLDQVENYYQQFLAKADYPLAAAAAGAAIALIYESGFQLSRMNPWSDRISSLLQSQPRDLPALAKSYLYSQKALASLVSKGDPDASSQEYLQAIIQAEEADSPSMRLYAVGYSGLALCHAGNFARFKLLVFDNAHLCSVPGIPLMHRAMFRVLQTSLMISQGMAHENAMEDLEELVSEPDFDCLPPMTWFTILDNLLLCYTWSGENQKAEQVAWRMMSLLVVERDYQYHSYLHLNMAVISMALEDYETALLRCQEAERLAAKSQSLYVAMQPPYVMGRVLLDSGKLDEGIELLEQWQDKWISSGFRLVAYLANLEIAQARLTQGDMLRGRKAFESAMEIIGNQDITAPGKPLDFVPQLRRGLGLEPLSCGQAGHTLIRIDTLGSLKVRIGNKILSGRQWRGRTTKILLAALIVKGGRNVSAAALMDMVWPLVEGDKASQRLKSAVFRLKRAGLGDGQEPLPWLIAKDYNYSIDSSLCAVDSLLFQQALSASLSDETAIDELSGALDLYTGGFWEVKEEPAWIAGHRSQLVNKYMSGALILARRCLEQKRATEALPYLDNALAMDHLREDIYAALMEIHLQAGEPARAGKVFKQAEEAVESSLGVKPGPVLTDLARRAHK